MIRTSLTILTAVAILSLPMVVAGCGSSDPDDEKMTQKREPPAEKRGAPGSGLGMSEEGGGDEGAPPPPPAGDGG